MEEPTEEEKQQMAAKAAAIEAKYAREEASAGAPAPSMPSAHVQDDGRESSMTVSDTNALRAKLGLKPLQEGSASKDDQKRAEHRAHLDRQRERNKATEAKEWQEKVDAKQEERRIANKLKKTRGLGEATAAADNDILVPPSPLRPLPHPHAHD